MSLNRFKVVLDLLNKGGLYPEINTIAGVSSSPEIEIKGKKYLTFCSNNYLGLANNKTINKAVKDAIKKYGIGSGGTRLLSGTLDVQVEFERKLAIFYDYADAITFSSGFLANIGTIRMLIDPFPYFSIPFLNKEGVIFSDELNHASLIDSIRLSKAERAIYKHNDIKDLEKLLVQHKSKNKLIVTDGIFSMDGDFADLVGISKLAKEYNALIFVDDSHGTGVLGKHGEGTAHYLGVEKDIDVIMGSFTKAWGSIGGFVVTKTKEVADYLRITARSYIFSDPILPAIVAGLIQTVKIIENGDKIRKKTIDNATYLRGELKKMGFQVVGEEFMPIIPPILHSEKNAIKFAQELFEVGILAPAIRRPAVKEGGERLRLTTMATHNKKQIDYLLDNMNRIGKKIKII